MTSGEESAAIPDDREGLGERVIRLMRKGPVWNRNHRSGACR